MTNSSTPDATTLLRLDKLTLHNFRCFTDCLLELDPNLTVLVAENAQGKTALLNAISIALDVFVAAIGHSQSNGFDRSDIHLIRDAEKGMVPAPIVKFDAAGVVDGEALFWGRSLSSSSPLARSSTKDVKAMRAAAERLAARLSDVEAKTPVTLPSVAFYGTGRLWDEHRLTEGKRWQASAKPTRFSAYLDCLSPSSSFKTFATWYEETSNSLRSSASKALGPHERPEKLLAAVRKAVEVVLEPTGWTKIDWDFPSVDEVGVPQGRGFLVVEHNERGRLPLSSLSDGVRNMVALVGDLAHRCVRLNPHFGENAASLTPGILLIDEVDMHLHPRWQQLVVDLLQKAFPAMQMILTTHSPQVLSTVDAESIRLIRLDNEKTAIRKPRFQTRGVESADILARLMDVDPVPQVEQACWLSDYRAMVQTGEHESDAGHNLSSKLIEHFGAEHPVLVEIDTLRRLQEFKKANNISPTPRPDHAQN